VPEPAEEKDFEVRSVALSSEVLGMSAKIDLVEGSGGQVCPVDYKRGKPPQNAERSYEPERVQLCAYGLLLREHGYHCDGGVLLFTESRVRVPVAFDDALVARTRELLGQARETAAAGVLPPPLRASPKCAGCSLHGVCLPDETNQLRGSVDPSSIREVRPPLEDGKPFYVSEQGMRVGLSGEVLEARDRERRTVGDAPLREVSQLVVYGNVQVSTQAIRELCERQVPICWMTFGGWLSGMTEGLGHNNVEVRRAQFRRADDEGKALALARRFVRVKIANCRTMLRRNHVDPPARSLQQMAFLSRAADGARSAAELLGIEGNAARLYFEALPGMLHPPEEAERMDFDFTTRSRRPPRDPVNALLSMGYSLLVKDVAIAARSVGLDPFVGFYHQPRFGRPALALDLMEEFRPLIADSVALFAVNTGTVTAKDFIRSSLGVSLRPEARKQIIKLYERRMDEEITHPVFGYRISYRRTLEVQCRLLARHLLGEVDTYPEFRTR
jgi:CRISP-associated protein Cas1